MSKVEFRKVQPQPQKAARLWQTLIKQTYVLIGKMAGIKIAWGLCDFPGPPVLSEYKRHTGERCGRESKQRRNLRQMGWEGTS